MSTSCQWCLKPFFESSEQSLLVLLGLGLLMGVWVLLASLDHGDEMLSKALRKLLLKKLKNRDVKGHRPSTLARFGNTRKHLSCTPTVEVAGRAFVCGECVPLGCST